MRGNLLRRIFSILSLAFLQASVWASVSETPKQIAQDAVTTELKASANDHSRWMYRDANKEDGKNTVTLVVQTRNGSLHKTLEIGGKRSTRNSGPRTSRRSTSSSPVLRNKPNNGGTVSMTTLRPARFLSCYLTHLYGPRLVRRMAIYFSTFGPTRSLARPPEKPESSRPWMGP